MQTQPRLLIVMAMRGEAEPIARRLGLSPPSTAFQPLPMLWREGRYRDLDIGMIINGVDRETQMDLIGTQPATLSTHVGITHFKPTAVLNFGTCGALASNGAQVGDLFMVSDRVWFHTRRIPLPGWDRYGLGGYKTAGTNHLADRLSLKSGVLSTTDSLDFAPVDKEMFSKVNADIADMEGAAIAWVSEIHGRPFYSIKGVTDLMDIDREVGEQFQKNFTPLVESIADAAVRLFDTLAGL